MALVIWIRPETKGFNHEQVENNFIGRPNPYLLQKIGMTYGSEWKLIDFGDSWFSAKAIKVVCN